MLVAFKAGSLPAHIDCKSASALELKRAVNRPVEKSCEFELEALALFARSVTCRARTRTSGFRARRLTVGGRHVLKNRRKKGRKVLAPGSYKK